jgi:hypothetical protein
MSVQAHASQFFERPSKRRHLNPELTEGDKEDSMAEAHTGQTEAAEEIKGDGPHLAEIPEDWKTQIWCLKGQGNLKIT